MNKGIWIRLLGYGLLIGLMVWLKIGLEPYDDSYFAKRFAHNFLSEGILGWNRSEGNIHGNTSQLFQSLIVVITAINDTYTIFFTRLFLASCLLLSFGVLTRYLDHERGSNTLLLTFTSPIALATVVSGMETATTL